MPQPSIRLKNTLRPPTPSARASPTKKFAVDKDAAAWFFIQAIY
jgi:hypothetical protein